jgi:hypothetical protein
MLYSTAKFKPIIPGGFERVWRHCAAKAQGFRNSENRSFINENYQGVQIKGAHIGSADTSPRDLFQMYVEFVLFRIWADIESYGNAARMVLGEREKMLLSRMASNKLVMHEKFMHKRGSDSRGWFESAFCGTPSSRVNYIKGNEGRPIVGVLDAFFYAYRKELLNLEAYEKIALVEPNPDAQNLLMQAAEIQHRHIAFFSMRKRKWRIKIPHQKNKTY